MTLLNCPHCLFTIVSPRSLSFSHFLQGRRRGKLTSETVSDMRSLVITTANLRRATDETVNLFSISDGLAFMSVHRNVSWNP